MECKIGKTKFIDPYGCRIDNIRIHLLTYDILTKKEQNYLINKMRKSMKNKTNITHLRVSVNNSNDVEFYGIKSHGCCNFHDETINLESGNTVEFGFCYEHLIDTKEDNECEEDR